MLNCFSILSNSHQIYKKQEEMNATETVCPIEILVSLTLIFFQSSEVTRNDKVLNWAEQV